MKYLYLITILIYLYISITASPVAALESGAKTEIKALIPAKTFLRIFGYTAPNALVQATSIRVFAQTSSDRTGYFQINELPVSEQAKELCLTTIDAQRRTGFPLCINIPETDLPAEIGPLLLSPTLSLSIPIIWQNQTAYLSGQTIPETEVVVSFFEVPVTNLAFNLTSRLSKLVRFQAWAFDLPILTTTSDTKGNYSTNLPSSKAVGYRVFTKAVYKNSPTPKSQTLIFSIGAIINYFYRYILPWILFILMIILASSWTVAYEVKTKKGRVALRRFNEKRLKPFAVRAALSLRRIWYNLREWWRSRQR